MKSGLSAIIGIHVGKSLEREFPFLGPVFYIASFIVLALLLFFFIYIIFSQRREIKEWFLFVLRNPKCVFMDFYRKHLCRPLKFGAVAAVLTFFLVLALR